MSLTTPAARRDLAYHLHPATNLRSVQTEGPLVITRGEGVYVYDDEGRRYLDGLAGLWCASLGFSERRLADAAYRQMMRAAVLSQLRRQGSGGEHAARGSADPHRARGDEPRALREFRIGGERHRGQARLVREQRARTAAEEEDRLAAARVPRHDRRRGEPHRPRLRADRLRPADRALPAHRLPALLPRRAARRERGGVCRPARREPRAADPARRPRHDRRVLRRAGDGRRRRDRAARDLFRSRAADPAESTRSCSSSTR